MSVKSAQNLDHFRSQQIKNWPLATTNYAALHKVLVKSFTIDGFKINVQFNPERVQSTTAKVDAISIKQRACFLCKNKRPKEQSEIAITPNFELLINPFPIFPVHFTIPHLQHTKQLIAHALANLLDIATEMENHILFYNGPFCGASAPDHLHFQAVGATEIPLFSWAENVGEILFENKEICIQGASNRFFNVLRFISHDKQAVIHTIKKVMHVMETKPEHDEPMLNLLCQFKNNAWQVILIPREKHRPNVFFAEGDNHFGISPASVDLGGVFVLPYQKDFERINEHIIQQVFTEVCYSTQKFDVFCKQIKRNLASSTL